MIEPSLAVQKALVARLTAADVLPQNAIFDRGGRPERFPCIFVGQAHSVFPDYVDSFATMTTADLHIWTEEADLASVKLLTGAAREAVWHGPWTIDGHRCVNLKMDAARFMRDPDGIHSHAVLTITAILQEDAQP